VMIIGDFLVSSLVLIAWSKLQHLTDAHEPCHASMLTEQP
jgi:hypothetical protein